MNDAKKLFMTVLRDQQTPIHEFRAAAHKLALILAQETLACVPMVQKKITTPLAHDFMGVQVIRQVTLVPILRSGLALLPAFLEFFPNANVGVLGEKRDEQTAIAHWYYKNMPPVAPDGMVIVLDPMLATAGSLLEALGYLTSLKIAQERIIYVGVISAQEGVDVVKKQYPNITMTIADNDQQLNDAKYIVPGLGDFGDRYFGTLA